MVKQYINSQQILRNDSTHNCRFVQEIYDIGALRKIQGHVNKNSITNIICLVNIAIPCTFWPVTNPIIKKISKKIDINKFIRKIRSIKMAIGKISYNTKTQINRKVYKPIKLLLFMENTNTKKHHTLLERLPNLKGTRRQEQKRNYRGEGFKAPSFIVTIPTKHGEGKTRFARHLKRKTTFEDLLAKKFKRNFGLEEVYC